jgi:hypothetical protein
LDNGEGKNCCLMWVDFEKDVFTESDLLWMGEVNTSFTEEEMLCLWRDLIFLDSKSWINESKSLLQVEVGEIEK